MSKGSGSKAGDTRKASAATNPANRKPPPASKQMRGSGSLKTGGSKK